MPLKAKLRTPVRVRFYVRSRNQAEINVISSRVPAGTPVRVRAPVSLYSTRVH